MARFTKIYYDLKKWRDFEISFGNMDKAKKIHKTLKKYKYILNI